MADRLKEMNVVDRLSGELLFIKAQDIINDIWLKMLHRGD